MAPTQNPGKEKVEVSRVSLSSNNRDLKDTGDSRMPRVESIKLARKKTVKPKKTAVKKMSMKAMGSGAAKKKVASSLKWGRGSKKFKKIQYWAQYGRELMKENYGQDGDNDEDSRESFDIPHYSLSDSNLDSDAYRKAKP